MHSYATFMCHRHHDGKLAAGALIGIGLASAFGTWALLALIVWWQLARRRTILTRVLAAHDLGTENWPTPKEALSINVAMFQKFLPKLTLGDLMKATDNFAIENVVGDGGFGTVYKASFQVRFHASTRKLWYCVLHHSLLRHSLITNLGSRVLVNTAHDTHKVRFKSTFIY